MARASGTCYYGITVRPAQRRAHTLPGADDGFALAKLANAAGCGVILVTGNAWDFEVGETSGHHYLLKPFASGACLRWSMTSPPKPRAASRRRAAPVARSSAT